MREVKNTDLEQAFRAALVYVEMIFDIAEAIQKIIVLLESNEASQGIFRLKELELALRKSHEDIMASMVPGSGARAH